MSERWQRVADAIVDFRKHLSADFPAIEMAHLYDFTKPELYKASRKTAPHTKAGVYLFYDAEGKLLYVGKASWTFDKRIWQHEDIAEARYLDAIPFEWHLSHFGLALEYFLISRFKPPYNKHGSGYDYAAVGARAAAPTTEPESPEEPSIPRRDWRPAGMSTSDAYARFQKSTNIGYDDWREGTPYEMEAFAQMSQAQRDNVTAEMMAKDKLDWRDMEVLAAVNSRETFDRLRGLLSKQESAQTQAYALRELARMPNRMSGNVPDAKLRDVLLAVTSGDGLTPALLLVADYAGPWSKGVLLRGVRDRPDVAIHFASALLDNAGLSSDMAAFDPKFRPTLIKLLPENTPIERMAAFFKVCEWLKIDAEAVPGPQVTEWYKWAEETWPREVKREDDES